MKTFAIRDEEIHPVQNLAFLFYYERQKQFYIEIPENVDPWVLPLILSDFAKKGIYTIDASWSRTWVSQRIIPPDRQNLGQILRDHGLSEYDEYRLLMLYHGRCEQDSCYLSEMNENELPEEIRGRLSRKVESALPLQKGRMLVFFRDGQTRLCDIGRITKGSPAWRRLFAYYREFQNVHVLAGGYGIGWDEDRAVSDRVLYKEGTSVPISSDDFRETLRTGLIDAREAAETLDCSRQYINILVKKGRLQPIRQFEKDTIFLRTDLDKEF